MNSAKYVRISSEHITPEDDYQLRYVNSPLRVVIAEDMICIHLPEGGLSPEHFSLAWSPELVRILEDTDKTDARLLVIDDDGPIFTDYPKF
jgi:hypothetical protein